VTSRHGRNPAAGFTLVELLLATALGALLVLAAAATAGVFAETVAELERTSSSEADQALARVTADIRYAWWVDVRSPESLRVADADGRVSEYYLHEGSLKVRRPSGEVGVLARGISSLAFTAQTAQRLREGSPVVRRGTIASADATALPPVALMLEDLDELVLGFLAPVDAGEGDVAGIREQVLALQPATLEIEVERATTRASSFEIVLAETKAPARARPRAGGAVGAVSYPVSSLPMATHAPIPDPGDLLGGDILDDGPLTVAVLPPTSSLSFDLSGVPPLEPGRGYAVVLRVVGTNARVVLPAHVQVPTREDVAHKDAGTAEYDEQRFVVPFRLVGDLTTTSTVAHDVPQTVHTVLTTADGRANQATTAVLGQVLAPDPWAGAVPGELPEVRTRLVDGVQVAPSP